MAHGEVKLEFESIPLTGKVFFGTQALRPVSEKIEARLAYESYPAGSCQFRKEFRRVHAYCLGMDAETRDCRGQGGTERFGTLEFRHVVRYHGAAPVRTGDFCRKAGIAVLKVDKVQVGIAVHGLIFTGWSLEVKKN